MFLWFLPHNVLSLTKEKVFVVLTEMRLKDIFSPTFKTATPLHTDKEMFFLRSRLIKTCYRVHSLP